MGFYSIFQASKTSTSFPLPYLAMRMLKKLWLVSCLEDQGRPYLMV
ncbi:hypothetical protein Lser_V15G28745 [Lactuca serriola]